MSEPTLLPLRAAGPAPSTMRYVARVRTVTVRLAEGAPAPGPVATDPRAAAELARAYLLDHLDHDREHLLALLLDARHQILGTHLAATGTDNAAAVCVRTLLRAALLAGATVLILAHNHPSGDPRPSAEDARLTDAIERAARTVGLHVLDHVVIGAATMPGAYVSLRETGAYNPTDRAL